MTDLMVAALRLRPVLRRSALVSLGPAQRGTWRLPAHLALVAERWHDESLVGTVVLLSYTIDASHRITEVNDAWNTFAEQNDAPTLSSQHVVGRILWDLIPAAEPLFLPLLERVRRDGRTLRLPFRCDAPTVRRLLEMELAPAPCSGTSFRVHSRRSQPRPAVRLLAAGGLRTPEYLTMCSWCKRVEVDVEWLEVEVALLRLRLLEHLALPRVTHGICPRCASKLMAASEGRGSASWVELPETD